MSSFGIECHTKRDSLGDALLYVIRRFYKSTALVFDEAVLSMFHAVTRFAAPSEQSILLLRLDGLGDYVLFRNFIAALHDSEKFKGYSITLCGNLLWKELAETLDNRWIDHYIWIDRNRILRSRLYKYIIVFKIRLRAHQFVIHPTYSRDGLADFVARTANARFKIGNSGDEINVRKEDKSAVDGLYSLLLPADAHVMFEVYRNREFFENLLEQSIPLTGPSARLTHEPGRRKVGFEGEYAVLFIGAGERRRKWGASNFAAVARHLYNRFGFHIVVAGGAEDVEESAEVDLQSHVPGIIRIAGRTSLVDLAMIIDDATLLISNDTGMVHLGASLGTTVICISTGNYFGRFCEYPKEMNLPVYCVYPPTITRLLHNTEHLKNLYRQGSKLDISDVSQDDVIRVVDSIVKR